MVLIPKTMKAVQIVEFHKPYRLNTVDVPAIIDPNDLLVKVAVASNCHTDSMVQSGAFATKLPCTASHEGAGTVVALGELARQRGFHEGQRVMCGLPLHPCGSCSDCVGPESQMQYCNNSDGYVGVQVDGCFAEYVKVDARTTTPLPDQISFLSAAPLACAGRTVWRGVAQTHLRPGQWVAIVGSGGGLGHLGVKFAIAKRLRVIGLDARDEGLELSQEYGAHHVIDTRKGLEPVVKSIHTLTNGKGADSTICLSDHQDAAHIACAITKPHGVVVQIAQPADVSIPFQEIILRDIKIHGSLICSSEESRDMLNCVTTSGISVRTQVFHGLENTEDLVEAVQAGGIRGKAVVIIDAEQIEREKQLGAKY